MKKLEGILLFGLIFLLGMGTSLAKEKKVSFNVRKKPLRQVVEFIGKKCNLKIIVDSDINEKITLKLDEVTGKTALKALEAKSNRLKIEEIGPGQFRVKAIPVVNMSFRDTEIAVVFRLLAGEAGVNLVIAPEVEGRVSLTVKDASAITVLKALAEKEGYGWLQRGGTILIIPRSRLEGKRREVKAKKLRLTEKEKKPHLSLNMKDKKLAEICRHLSKAADVNIFVDSNVKGTFQAQIGSSSWRNVLEAVAKLAGCKVIKISPKLYRVVKVPTLSMEFTKGEIKTVLDMVGKASGKTIWVGKNVRGQISCVFRDSSWKFALERICEAAGLKMEEKGEGIYLVINPHKGGKKSKKETLPALPSDVLKKLKRSQNEMEEKMAHLLKKEKKKDQSLKREKELAQKIASLKEKVKKLAQRMEKEKDGPALKKVTKKIKKLEGKVTPFSKRTVKGKENKSEEKVSPEEELVRSLNKNWSRIRKITSSENPLALSSTLVESWEKVEEKVKDFSQIKDPDLRIQAGRVLAAAKSHGDNLKGLLARAYIKEGQRLLERLSLSNLATSYQRWREILHRAWNLGGAEVLPQARRLFQKGQKSFYRLGKNKLQRTDELSLNEKVRQISKTAIRLRKLFPRWSKGAENKLLTSIGKIRIMARLRLEKQALSGEKIKVATGVIARRYHYHFSGDFTRFLYFLHKVESLEAKVGLEKLKITASNGKASMWSRTRKIKVVFRAYYLAGPPSFSKKGRSPQVFSIPSEIYTPQASLLWNWIPFYKRKKAMEKAAVQDRLLELSRLYRELAEIEEMRAKIDRLSQYRKAIVLLEKKQVKWTTYLLEISRQFDRHKGWLGNLAIRHPLEKKKRGELKMEGWFPTQNEGLLFEWQKDLMQNRKLSYIVTQNWHLQFESVKLAIPENTYLDERERECLKFSLRIPLKR